jgi:putative colanic acid biosynthesis UDP-glucose lipid carrier transferase
LFSLWQIRNQNQKKWYNFGLRDLAKTKADLSPHLSLSEGIIRMPTGYHKIGLGAAVVAVSQRLTLPIVCFVMLYVSAYVHGIQITDQNEEQYLALGLIATLLSYIFSRPQQGELYGLSLSGWTIAEKLTMAWVGVVATLLLFGYAGKVSAEYSRRALLTWFLITPPISVAVWIVLRAWLGKILLKTGTSRSVVIAGVNAVSRRLASSMEKHPEFGLAFKGFFEDRGRERLGDLAESSLLGKLDALPGYARAHQIDTIFIAIPISHVERTNALLDELKDTTLSIYFVPDIFVVDLIQSRSDEVNGIPVLALCETPFHGWRGVLKRLSDIILASTMLAIAAPAMLFIAAGIKLTTPGSVIFRQRRYGPGGEEIMVYKFRTMLTSDDGSQIEQASQNDSRVTSFGRILRRYSLDELPQLVNVLQGRMSVVGPRPHAVAHNEEYRKLIKGYMVRHKVAPGITGLAQVNGCRGETSEVEDMELRVRYDLLYVREWSLLLDLKILAQTARILLGDEKAY